MISIGSSGPTLTPNRRDLWTLHKVCSSQIIMSMILACGLNKPIIISVWFHKHNELSRCLMKDKLVTRNDRFCKSLPKTRFKLGYKKWNNVFVLPLNKGKIHSFSFCWIVTSFFYFAMKPRWGIGLYGKWRLDKQKTPPLGAMDECESKWRPWKTCVAGVERCEGGYCVLQLWFVMLASILVLMFTFSFMFVTNVYFNKVIPYVITLMTLLSVCSLGVIIVGNAYAYMWNDVCIFPYYLIIFLLLFNYRAIKIMRVWSLVIDKKEEKRQLFY